MPFLEDFIGRAYEAMAAVTELFPSESKPLPETVVDESPPVRPAYTEERNFQQMLLFLKPG